MEIWGNAGRGNLDGIGSAKMMTRRLLYAPNIHQGGGRSLLLPLLVALKDAVDVVFVLDDRLQFPEWLRLTGEAYRIKATLCSRLWFEWQLRRLVTPDTLVLCMGNLPPLLARVGKITVFVQNRYLIEDVSLDDFSLPVRMRIRMERWWLRSRASGVGRFIVQTPTMQRLLQNSLGRKADVLPFAALSEMKNGHTPVTDKVHDFLYVASGEPHKNHRTLIEAWIEMAKRGKFPSLCLTLDAGTFPKLCTWIEAMKLQHGLKIKIIGDQTYQDIQRLYRVSRVLIYPSLFESFGLPLLEAAAAGLPIAAADVEYVYDVIKPTVVFDPNSPESIANIVMNIPETPARIVPDLLNANSFLANVFGN